MAASRMRPHLWSIASMCVSVSVLLGPSSALAAPAPDTSSSAVEGPARPVEGPASPPADPADDPTTANEAATETAAPSSQPPPPTFVPPDEPGIEFRIPAPVPEQQPPPARETALAASFPDPGVAPNDGAAMMVLGSTAVGLTLAGLGAGLAVGINNQIPLEWLLPSTLIPSIGVLAFAGGGLGLGIQRARAHRRWEIGYRVVGTPQGGGLAVGGSFMLLAALAFIPSGAFALSNGEVELGASFIAIGSMSAVAMPIMFSISTKRQREYARTGGWYRRPIPQLRSEAQLRLTPRISPLPGGATVGVGGRF